MFFKHTLLSLSVFWNLSSYGYSITPEDVIVDLQFSICQNDVSRLPQSLGFVEEAKEGYVTYYDRKDFFLTRQGIFLKLKEKKKTETSSVKIVIDRMNIPALSDLECEIDRYGNARQMKCEIEKDVIYGHLWSKEQKMLAENRGTIDWDNLVSIGPFHEQKWKRSYYNLPVSLDVLFVPGRQPIAELSVKTTFLKEARVYESINGWLVKNGVSLCRVQQGKIFRLIKQ